MSPTQLRNPPALLFPATANNRMYIGGTTCVVGAMEGPSLQAYPALWIELMTARMLKGSKGVVDDLTMEADVGTIEEAAPVASALARNLQAITSNRHFLLGIMRFECNAFEKFPEFHANWPEFFNFLVLNKVFTSAIDANTAPPIIHPPPPREFLIVFHHTRPGSVLDLAWQDRTDLSHQVQQAAGRVFGIAAFEVNAGVWAIHFYVLAGTFFHPGAVTTYPDMVTELYARVTNQQAFPIAWFQFDFGYPFALSSIPVWKAAERFAPLQLARAAYEARAP